MSRLWVLIKRKWLWSASSWCVLLNYTVMLGQHNIELGRLTLTVRSTFLLEKLTLSQLSMKVHFSNRSRWYLPSAQKPTTVYCFIPGSPSSHPIPLRSILTSFPHLPEVSQEACLITFSDQTFVSISKLSEASNTSVPSHLPYCPNNIPWVTQIITPPTTKLSPACSCLLPHSFKYVLQPANQT
jgi:hypothetical protein